ncbi:MAG: hypothetical protein R2716_14160 [Microthrixaceae bacterium]
MANAAAGRRTGSRARGLAPLRRLLPAALGALALVAASCGGDEAAEPEDTSPTSQATTTAEAGDDGADSGDQGASAAELDDAPALVATSQANLGSLLNPSEANELPAGMLNEGPRLPLAYMSDPTAEVVITNLDLEDDEDEVAAPLATRVAKPVLGTAVSGNTFEVTDVETGEVIDTHDFGTDRFGTFIWAPDDSAYFDAAGKPRVLHRVGGGTASAESDNQIGQLAFAANDDTTEMLTCFAELTRFTVGDDEDSGEASGTDECDAVAQTFDEDGNPVALYTANGKLYRLDAGAEPAELLDVGAVSRGTFNEIGLQTCADTVQVVFSGDVGRPPAIYDPRTGSLTETPTIAAEGDVILDEGNARLCPVMSPERDKMAIVAKDSTIQVVDVESGEAVKVAESGDPVAFGSDAETLLVYGNGTFLVAADGSGGEEASAQVSPGGAAVREMCAVGSTGKALLLTESGVVLFDIDADEATETPGTEIGPGCSTTPDGEYVVTNSLLVRTSDGEAAALPGIDVDTGERDTPDSIAPGRVSDYMWFGPQVVTPGHVADS